MAVNGTTMDAPQRRVVFGFNVGLQVLLVIAIVAVLVWVAGRFNAQADWTSTGRNSLSSRTVQLLRGLNQDIRLTALYPEPEKRDELGQKRRRQLQDLFALYEQAGGARISTAVVDSSLDKGKTEALLKRILELPAYKDEARTHQEALARFTTLVPQIQALTAAEFNRLDEAMRGSDLARVRNLNIIRSNFRTMSQDLQQVQEKLKEHTEGEFPRFGQAVREVRDYLNQLSLMLDDASRWMSTEGLATPGLTPELQEFFQQAPGRYAGVLAEVRALADQTKDLKELKVEELYSGLTRWRTQPPVLVENEHEARLVSNWDIWTMPRDRDAPIGPDGDDRIFDGESAISSAILQLSREDKTGVVFVRFGGQQMLRPDFNNFNPMMMQQMPTAPYQELNGLLGKAGFVTAEWDVQKQKTPPTFDPNEPGSGVEGKPPSRRIYVVFPPEPPPQRNPMQPQPQGGMTPEDRKAVLDAVNASGLAVFMAGWTPPTSPIPGMGGAYEYGEYLKSNWGIEIEHQNLTLQFMPHPEKDKRGQYVPASRQPQLLTTDDVVRLTDHPIAAPLGADRAGFALVAPIELLRPESRPVGVQITPIAEIRKTEDAWAVSNIMELQEQLKRNQGVTRSPTDVVPPFPIAVAATKLTGMTGGTATQPATGGTGTQPATGAGEQRIVVISAAEFASDQLAAAPTLQQVGNALVLAPLYPANNDLFVNALHWLTGESNRIAVGPRRGEAPRLKDLDEAWAARLPVFFVGVWPAVALVLGLGVWLVRRA